MRKMMNKESDDRIFSSYWAKQIAKQYEIHTGEKISDIEIIILEHHLKKWTNFIQSNWDKDIKNDEK